MRRSNNHDRIIFNGHDLSSLVMCRMERPIMPPVEVSRETVGGRHGELFRRARMQSYTVPVSVWLRTKDRRRVADLRHRLAAMLWTEEPAPLYLPDDPTRYHMAIVEGETSLGAIKDEIPATTISFRICDPVAYGNDRTEGLVTGVATNVDAGGTFPASPVVSSTTSGGTWKLLNVTTGAFVEVNAESVGADIVSGASIVCDMANERVTMNGNTVGVSVDSDFFTISGRMALQVTGGTATKIDWQERWI